MNARQDDTLSMDIVVENLLNETPSAILDQMPEIEMLKHELTQNNNTIELLIGGQQLNRTGNRMTKEEYREVMTKLAFRTAARTCAYAISIEDEVLQMSVTYVYSDLENIRDTQIAAICKSIHDIALPLLTNLSAYGITEENLNELKASIDIYKVVQPKTRAGLVTQTTFTDRIEELLQDNTQLLFRIDKLVIMLRFDEEEFYSEYFKSRKLIDTGHRKLSIKGTITNEQGQPINNVIITVETPIEVSAKSTELGNYQFKGVEAGVWPVTFNRNGYITEKVFLVFTPNQRIDFNVTLKAAELQERSA